MICYYFLGHQSWFQLSRNRFHNSSKVNVPFLLLKNLGSVLSCRDARRSKTSGVGLNHRKETTTLVAEEHVSQRIEEILCDDTGSQMIYCSFGNGAQSNADVTCVDPPPPSFTCKNAASPTTTIPFFYFYTPVPSHVHSNNRQNGPNKAPHWLHPR